MSKTTKIIYWISTVWMSLGMASSGIVQCIKMKEEVAMFSHLGYPVYLLPFLGILKLLGVVVVFLPKFPMLKEWAYAGFFFTMLGALYSHVAIGDGAQEIFGPVLLLVLIALSWYFRPEGKKLTSASYN